MLVSMLAVRVPRGAALTFCFGLAGRDYNFDGSAFYILLQNVSSFGLGLTFRAVVPNLFHLASRAPIRKYDISPRAQSLTAALKGFK